MSRRCVRPLLAVFLVASFAAACAPREEAPLSPPRSFSVFFPTGTADITPEASVVLDHIAEEARRIGATAVGIVGTSSAAGPSGINLKLSEERAAAVEDALVARNVPRDIVVRTYHGAVQDLAGPELSAQRVEVVVSREARR